MAELIIRPVEDIDLGAIAEIDEKIGGKYRPEVWEQRVGYYLRRDPEASHVAVAEGRVVGFMLGEVRSGDFGLEEPTGWIEVLGVDPDARRMNIGRQLAEALLEHFRGKGATSVRTLVDESMEGIGGFFTSLGFEPAPVQPFILKLQ